MIDSLLIVGLGSIGRRHARIARSLLPDATIVALRHRDCDDEDSRLVNRCVTSLNEALEFKPQLAVIATPASKHLDSAIPLAAAGVSLLVEKPIAASDVGVPEFISMCHAGSVKLRTGYNLRYSRSLGQFRRLLEDRVVGKVLSVRAEVGQALAEWRPGSDYRRGPSGQSALGGGVLLELSHEFDYLRWLFGEVSWVSAVTRKHSQLEIDVEDTAYVLLGFSADNPGAEVVASVNLDFVRHDATRTCTVIGETGTVRWDGINNSVHRFEPQRREWRLLFSELAQQDDTYVAEWEKIIRPTDGASDPGASGEDGLAALRIAGAARKSSDSGRVVTLPPVVAARVAADTLSR